MIRIRLIRKLAASLNGVDLSSLHVGDVIDLPDSAARMMIAERWAELVADSLAATTQKPSPSTSPN